MDPIGLDIQALAEAGIGLSLFIAMIVFLALVRQMLKPFNRMTDFVEKTQDRSDTNQAKLGNIIDKNTETLVSMKDDIKSLVARVLDENDIALKYLSDIKRAQVGIAEGHPVGLMILDDQLFVTIYSTYVLLALGWKETDLPTKANPSTPPMLTMDNEPLKKEAWPAAIALRLRTDVLNNVLQIFNRETNSFEWVMVSAFMCDKCTVDDGDRVVVVVQKLDSLRRLA